ncbi:MAG: hypothetical protein KAR47_08815, partial [Planctomycetes bacterium]|nr:hypothetical protein [Planctomycetota bacterium]
MKSKQSEQVIFLIAILLFGKIILFSFLPPVLQTLTLAGIRKLQPFSISLIFSSTHRCGLNRENGA